MLTRESLSEEAMDVLNDSTQMGQVKELIQLLDEELTGVNLKAASDKTLNLAVLHHHANSLIAGFKAILSKKQGKLFSLPSACTPSLTDLAIKPLLKINEVEKLTGLSRATIYEAIRTRKLKAVFIDHELRVQRSELDDFTKSL